MRELIETLLDDSGPDMRAVQQCDTDWLDGGAALLVLKDAYHGPDMLVGSAGGGALSCPARGTPAFQLHESYAQ